MELLAKRLKWLREKKRLAQKEVAAEIGVSLNAYQKWEYNEREPKLDTLVTLSKILGESTDFLLGITDETKQLREKQILLIKAEREMERSNIVIDELATLGNSLVDEMRIQLHENREVYKKHLFEYMCIYYDISESIPERDKWIKEILPFEIKLVEPQHHNNWTIEIKRFENKWLTIGMYTDKESANQSYENFKTLFRMK